MKFYVIPDLAEAVDPEARRIRVKKLRRFGQKMLKSGHAKRYSYKGNIDLAKWQRAMAIASKHEKPGSHKQPGRRQDSANSRSGLAFDRAQLKRYGKKE